MIYTFSFTRGWPSLGVGPGHYLAVNTQVQYPFHTLDCRPVRLDRGELLAAIAEGAAEILTPHVNTYDVAMGIKRRPRS